MATNPELCNPLEGWKNLFTKIMTKADSKELLEASIYFDFRCIYGKKQLVDDLWEHLFTEKEIHTLFMRHLAENMLQASRPPIKKIKWHLPGFLRVNPPSFDIKREATAPLDAAVRLLALNDGVTETHTLERLQKVMEMGHMPKSLADEVHNAFDFILRLRFRLEFKGKGKTADENHRVDVGQLLPLQVKNLKDALKTIYQLQDYAFTQVTQTNVPWSMK
jgi:CBS domain-containing protein